MRKVHGIAEAFVPTSQTCRQSAGGCPVSEREEALSRLRALAVACCAESHCGTCVELRAAVASLAGEGGEGE